MIKVCRSCRVLYSTWQRSLDDQDFLYGHQRFLLLRAHVLRCRYVARSMGESLLHETYERYNRRQRDVDQAAEYKRRSGVWNTQRTDYVMRASRAEA